MDLKSRSSVTRKAGELPRVWYLRPGTKAIVYLLAAPRWYEVHWMTLVNGRRRSRGCTDPECPPSWHRLGSISTGFAPALLWCHAGGPLGQWQSVVVELGWALGRDLEDEAGPSSLRHLLLELSSKLRTDGVPQEKAKILDRSKPPGPLPPVPFFDPEPSLLQLWKIPTPAAQPTPTLAVREERLQSLLGGVSFRKEA